MVERIHEKLRNEILERRDIGQIEKNRAEMKAEGKLSNELNDLQCEIHNESDFLIVTKELTNPKIALCNPCMSVYLVDPKNELIAKTIKKIT